MKKLLLLFLLTTTNSLAWHIDYNLALPGSSPSGVDYINYIIFSKDLLSEQNEKMQTSNHNSPVITPLVLSSNGTS